MLHLEMRVGEKRITLMLLRVGDKKLSNEICDMFDVKLDSHDYRFVDKAAWNSFVCKERLVRQIWNQILQQKTPTGLENIVKTSECDHGVSWGDHRYNDEIEKQKPIPFPMWSWGRFLLTDFFWRDDQRSKTRRISKSLISKNKGSSSAIDTRISSSSDGVFLPRRRERVAKVASWTARLAACSAACSAAG